jgi:hypothetical protein
VAGVEGVKVTEFNASEGPSREQTGMADWLQREEKEPKTMAAVRPVGGTLGCCEPLLRGWLLLMLRWPER